MNHRFTLVPSEFFSERDAREILSEVVPLEEGEPLSFVSIPAMEAVMIYAGPVRPQAYEMLMSLCKLGGHNRIIAHYEDGWLCLVVSQGDSLKFCNCFKVSCFIDAEYYILMALKKLQLNPEQSTIYFTSPLSEDQTVSLLNYFKNAEPLR